MGHPEPNPERTTVYVFADFLHFTHWVVYPQDRSLHPGKYPSHGELLPHRVRGLLEDWQLSFEKFASADFDGQPGTMLWIAFDVEALRICRMLKRHIGDRARVIYQKPIQDPFCAYEYTREVLEDGSTRVLD